MAALGDFVPSAKALMGRIPDTCMVTSTQWNSRGVHIGSDNTVGTKQSNTKDRYQT